MNIGAVHHDSARLLRLATYASTGVALLLIGVKLVAWLMTGSLSILASLVDSLMDAAASLINLFAIRYSLRSADADHQFGHGKAEALAGLGQASFVAGSAIFLLIQAAERLGSPRTIEGVGLGLAVMGFAMAATLLLLAFQGYVIRRTSSSAIRADALHYRTDLFTNLLSVAALFLAGSGWTWVDPLCALGIAVYILFSARQIGMDAMQILMDRELSDKTRAAISAIARAQPGVLDLHDLRTRQSGQTIHIQLHLNLSGALLLAEAHRIAKEVELAIVRIFPQADVIIHQDPVDLTLWRAKSQEGDAAGEAAS